MDVRSVVWVTPPIRRRLVWLLVPVLILLALYIGLLALYALGGRATIKGPTSAAVPAGGVLLQIKPSAMQADTDRLSVDVNIQASAELAAGPTADGLTQDVLVAMSPLVGSQQLTFPAGQTPGTISTQMSLEGDIENWPFDKYTSRMTVEVFSGTGAARHEIPAAVVFRGHIQGWRLTAESVVPAQQATLSAPQAFDIEARRAPATIAFAAIIVCVLIALAAMSTFVAVSTYRSGRKVEPTLAGWMAAMLFATIPLRNFLPGSPPAGAWVDAAVVLWVIVALVASLALYLFIWWQNGKSSPEVDEVSTPPQ